MVTKLVNGVRIELSRDEIKNREQDIEKLTVKEKIYKEKFEEPSINEKVEALWSLAQGDNSLFDSVKEKERLVKLKYK